MGNCCIPPCDQDPLTLSIDRKDSLSDLPKIGFSKQVQEKSFDSLSSENSKKNLKKSLKIIVVQAVTAEGSKTETLANFYESSGFKCFCGLNFVWEEKLVQKTFEKSGDWNICCSDCQTIFSSAGWRCEKCDLKICPGCSNSRNQLVPQLSCKNQHVLDYSVESLLLRHEKFNKKSFECGKCLKLKMEECFSCNQCDFNVCIRCAEDSGINVRPLNTCFEKHLLDYQNSQMSSTVSSQCSVCFKDGTKDRVSCDDCEYSLCFYCLVQTFNDKVVHPGIQCKSRHSFQLETMKKLRKHKEKWIICLRCSRANMKYTYGCKVCEECLCLSCMRDVISLIQQFSSTLCPRGHQYLWNPVNQQVKKTCYFCQSSLDFSGFFCRSCNHSICVECIQYSNSFISRSSNISIS